jgi:hypothetical protein
MLGGHPYDGGLWIHDAFATKYDFCLAALKDFLGISD